MNNNNIPHSEKLFPQNKPFLLIDGTKLKIESTGAISPEIISECKKHDWGDWEDHFPEIGKGSRFCSECGDTEEYQMYIGDEELGILDQLESELFSRE